MIDLAYSLADQNFATTKSLGIYNFSLRLAESLAKHPRLRSLTVFSNRTVSRSLLLGDKARVTEHDYAAFSKVGRILWDQWKLYRCARATRHKWLFLPKGFCSFLTSPRPRVAAYVHDIMGEYYNLRYPGTWSRLESAYFTRSMRATLRQSSVVFTNTEFSKSELVNLARRSGVPNARIEVAGYGFDQPQAAASEKENRLLLFASTMPHKRTDLAIDYLCRWLRESKFNGVIDCIGILSPQMQVPDGKHWNWIGRVPPARGREMMRRARAVIYVSEYEGFGMPPVEAVLDGTCPVFSDIPALREVMAGAGRPFSNESPDSFSRAINQAVGTPRESIAAWAERLLRRHNWPAVTERIMQGLSAA